MITAQPDLFGEAGERDAARDRMRQPATCQWCRATERSGYSLEQNHVPDCRRAQQTTWCIAMDLTLSHVRHDVEQAMEFGAKAKSRRHYIDALTMSLDHVRTVWANRLDDLEAELTKLPIDKAWEALS